MKILEYTARKCCITNANGSYNPRGRAFSMTYQNNIFKGFLTNYQNGVVVRHHQRLASIPLRYKKFLADLDLFVAIMRYVMHTAEMLLPSSRVHMVLDYDNKACDSVNCTCEPLSAEPMIRIGKN